MAQKRSVNSSRKPNRVTTSSSGQQIAANEETARLKKRTREDSSLTREDVVPSPQGEASRSAETATPPGMLDLNSKEAASGFALESPETFSFLNEVPGQGTVEMEEGLDLDCAFGSPVDEAKQAGGMAARGDLEESPDDMGADWWSERLSGPAEAAEGSSGKKGCADGTTMADEQPLVDLMVPSLANSLELPVPDLKQPAGDLEDLTSLLFQDDDTNDDSPYWDSRTEHRNSASAFEWAATPDSSVLHQPQSPFADLEKQVSAVQALLPMFGPSSTFPQEQREAAFDGVASIVARLASSIALKSLEQPQESAPAAAREVATLRAENEELRLQLQNREGQLEALQEGLGVMMNGLCRLQDVSHVDDSTQK